jgi:hypothetical protein
LLANCTPKSKCGSREKFEDGHFNKPTSINSNFRGGKKSHDAKRIKKTKNQSIKPLSEKSNVEDFEQKEYISNLEIP